MARSISMTSINQINMQPKPVGLRAVFLVETRDEAESKELARQFRDFSPVIEVRQLCKGKLVAYAVQLQDHDQSLLDELHSFLKKNYGLVILHRTFDAVIYNIVRELCKDSGSVLLPIHKCDICGKPEPFPETTISFLDKENVNLATRLYCATCTAESSRRSNKEFLKALLQADRSDFGVIECADLVRRRSSKKYIAFQIKADAEQCIA